MSIPLLKLASMMDALRGFVAVGRRMSITQAAQDLCLTQSAVSRQVQSLEERLGVVLFVRGHRSLAFTEDGERLFRSADSALQQLQDVIGSLGHAGERRPVTVSASIGVAALWLLPRLGRFQADHPAIDLRVAASDRVVDLHADGIDIALRYSAASGVPANALRLFDETVVPVAHPALGLKALRSRSHITRNVLLEFDDPRRPWLRWPDWLHAQGWAQVQPRAVLRFNQYDLVVQSALAGQGIALGRIGLLRDLLASGRLMVLPTLHAGPPTDHAYWMLRGDAPGRSEVDTVARWLMQQASHGHPDQPGSRSLA